jgi:hypothetical protein
MSASFFKGRTPTPVPLLSRRPAKAPARVAEVTARELVKKPLLRAWVILSLAPLWE